MKRRFTRRNAIEGALDVDRLRTDHLTSELHATEHIFVDHISGDTCTKKIAKALIKNDFN